MLLNVQGELLLSCVFWAVFSAPKMVLVHMCISLLCYLHCAIFDQFEVGLSYQGFVFSFFGFVFCVHWACLLGVRA